MEILPGMLSDYRHQRLEIKLAGWINSGKPRDINVTALLALKLKALRVSEFDSGSGDLVDTAALLRVLQITEPEDDIPILAEYFPKSAIDAGKQHFVLKRLHLRRKPTRCAPLPWSKHRRARSRLERP
jgi:hypothetical protein